MDAVARAVSQLIQYGKVIRPSLRIQARVLPGNVPAEEDQDSFQSMRNLRQCLLVPQVAGDQVASSLRVGKGALVQSVDASSNAAKAGLLGTRRTLAGISAGDEGFQLDVHACACLTAGSSQGVLLRWLSIRPAGDVIVALDRRQVVRSGDLLAALDEHQIGDKVALKVRRDAANGSQGKQVTMDLVLQEEMT